MRTRCQHRSAGDAVGVQITYVANGEGIPKVGDHLLITVEPATNKTNSSA